MTATLWTHLLVARIALPSEAVADRFLDAHLMIERPDHYFDRFVRAGVNLICFHVELGDSYYIRNTLGRIREAGVKNGLGSQPGHTL